jgi:hypothetical protein
MKAETRQDTRSWSEEIVRRVVCTSLHDISKVSFYTFDHVLTPYSRRNSTILSWLHRINRTHPNPLVSASHARLPRRHVLLAAPHGVDRESQLRPHFQAYVFPHVASCRNPIVFTPFSAGGSTRRPPPPNNCLFANPLLIKSCN